MFLLLNLLRSNSACCTLCSFKFNVPSQCILSLFEPPCASQWDHRFFPMGCLDRLENCSSWSRIPTFRHSLAEMHRSCSERSCQVLNLVPAQTCSPVFLTTSLWPDRRNKKRDKNDSFTRLDIFDTKGSFCIIEGSGELFSKLVATLGDTFNQGQMYNTL